MSNTPLPVPSKAALRALRGIVLGTSCTLALIAEDRRRRINMAHSAIQNGNRLRSARRYHSGSGHALAGMLEETLSVEPGVVHWQAEGVLPGRMADAEQVPAEEQTDRSTTASSISPTTSATASTAFPATSTTSPAILQPMGSLIQQADEYRSRLRSPALPLADTPTTIDRITELTTAEARLDEAVALLMAITPAALQPDALDASAALCRACQSAGRMDLAEAVLQQAVQSGQLDEATYLAHSPMAVVEAILAAYDAPTAETTAEKHKEERLRTAVALFLPPVAGERTRPASEFAALGRQLLERTFAAGKQRMIRSVYASLSASPGDLADLTHWFLGRLQAEKRYKLMVWCFLQRQEVAAALAMPDFLTLGDWITEAVRQTSTAHAGVLLTALLRACATKRRRRLRTAWVADLLYAQWRAAQDYAAVEQLFDGMVASDGGLAACVHHVDGAYRVMVQIALEAGQAAAAQRHVAALQAVKPAAAADIRVLGLLALAQARRGNWEGAWARFAEAAEGAADGQLATRDAERAFVPLVQEHLRTHALEQTEAWVKRYLDVFAVPIGRPLVTLLAYAYGARREVDAFIGWLAFCARAGFAVDAAFSNAILNSARKHWKFSFRDLRTLYRKLGVLSPRFADRVTAAIMTSAAASDAKYMGRAAQGRILSLRVDVLCADAEDSMRNTVETVPHGTPTVTSVLSIDRPRDEPALFLAMKTAWAMGHPAKAARLYRQAIHSGGSLQPQPSPALSERCLRLAVAATLRNPHQAGDPVAAALALLRSAQAAGLAVDGAAAYVAMACFDRDGAAAAARYGRRAAADAVQAVLCQLDDTGLRITDMALNRAAYHVFRAGHMRGAVALALAAAKAADPTTDSKCIRRAGRPGYNVWNFAVLVSAYAYLAEPLGLRGVIDCAGPVLAEPVAYRVLKHARRHLRKTALAAAADAEVSRDGRQDDGDDDNVDNDELVVSLPANDPLVQSLAAVDAGLARSRAARQQRLHDQRHLETAAVDLMRRAAIDSGQPPVDFAQVPFLRRQDGPVDWALPELLPATPSAPLVACST